MTRHAGRGNWHQLVISGNGNRWHPAGVGAWLRELGVSPRTRNNLRNAIQTFFNFAKARRYLPKDHDELDAVAVAKARGGAIEIFTPG